MSIMAHRIYSRNLYLNSVTEIISHGNHWQIKCNFKYENENSIRYSDCINIYFCLSSLIYFETGLQNFHRDAMMSYIVRIAISIMVLLKDILPESHETAIYLFQQLPHTESDSLILKNLSSAFYLLVSLLLICIVILTLEILHHIIMAYISMLNHI